MEVNRKGKELQDIVRANREFFLAKLEPQIEEGWRIQFSPKKGIVYSGVVTSQSQRYLFVEMAGNKLSVLKNDPSIKIVEKEKPTYGIPYPCPSATCPDDEDKAAKKARKRLKKRRGE